MEAVLIPLASLQPSRIELARWTHTPKTLRCLRHCWLVKSGKTLTFDAWI